MRATVLTLLLCLACTKPRVDAPQPKTLAPGMHTFETCDAALAYFQQEAVFLTAKRAEALRNLGPCPEVTDCSSPDFVCDPWVGSPAPPTALVTDHGTAGVRNTSRAALFSRDGNIFALALTPSPDPEVSDHLVSVKLTPASSTAVVSASPVGFHAYGVATEGNVALVVAFEDVDLRNTLVTLLDLTDPTGLRALRAEHIAGRPTAVRLVDGVVYVTTTYASESALSVARPFDRVCSGGDAFDSEVDAQLVQRVAALEKTTLADWLPAELVAQCGQLRRPGRSSGPGLTMTTSVSMHDVSAQWTHSVFIADGARTYFGETGLYAITSSQGAAAWFSPVVPGDLGHDYSAGGILGADALPALEQQLTRFAPTNAALAPSASMVLPGCTKPESMDEWMGNLRVVTTSCSRFEPAAGPTSLTVLHDGGGTWNAVGPGMPDVFGAQQYFFNALFSGNFVDVIATAPVIGQPGSLVMLDLTASDSPIVQGSGATSWMLLYPIDGNRTLAGPGHSQYDILQTGPGASLTPINAFSPVASPNDFIAGEPSAFPFGNGYAVTLPFVQATNSNPMYAEQGFLLYGLNADSSSEFLARIPVQGGSSAVLTPDANTLVIVGTNEVDIIPSSAFQGSQQPSPIIKIPLN